MRVFAKEDTVKVLVIRISAMGDVAMTAPVIERLRKNYPNAHITVLTPSFLRPFFREINDVEFFAPDFEKRHKGVIGIFRLFRDLGKFDVVADLHDVLRSKMLRKYFCLAGAKVVNIDKDRDAKNALIAIDGKKLVQLKTTVQRYIDVFTKLGFDMSGGVEPRRITYTMNRDVAALAGSKNGLWIGIAPFAQHRGKIYPTEKMEQVVTALAQEIPDLRIFIFGGGASEKQFAEHLEDKITCVRSVIGRVKLQQEMELISNLDIMVSMDSSAMHMSSLVGLPVISVWGATHPYAGFYGLGQREEDAVQLDMPCRPCSIYGNKPCIYGNYPCMNGIDPCMIVDKVKSRLNLHE